MNKYIIRNCPAIYGIDDGFLCSYREDDESEKYCYDCTDCKLKQIVGKCIELYNMECKNRYKTNGYILAFDILKELDIQEAK